VSTLRFVTYLAPSLPREYFAGVAQAVARALGNDASLRCVTSSSAPLPGEADPFSLGEADVGFVCAPGYFWLSKLTVPPVELVPAAPVFGDSRTNGEPVYFADVVVRRQSAARTFDELAGSKWVSNDPGSLSGHFVVIEKLGEIHADPMFFGSMSFSGSHLASIAEVRAGRADAAAVDSNVLALERKRDPSIGRELRIPESWGPYPIQPIVVRAGLGAAAKRAIAATLLALHRDRSVRPPLEAAGVRRFAPTSDTHYEAERARFERGAGEVRRKTRSAGLPSSAARL
jgi:ABC-type phosphate/phosphonate transport system substrate-binding protein